VRYSILTAFDGVFPSAALLRKRLFLERSSLAPFFQLFCLLMPPLLIFRHMLGA